MRDCRKDNLAMSLQADAVSGVVNARTSDAMTRSGICSKSYSIR